MGLKYKKYIFLPVITSRVDWAMSVYLSVWTHSYYKSQRYEIISQKDTLPLTTFISKHQPHPQIKILFLKLIRIQRIKAATFLLSHTLSWLNIYVSSKFDRTINTEVVQESMTITTSACVSLQGRQAARKHVHAFMT